MGNHYRITGRSLSAPPDDYDDSEWHEEWLLARDDLELLEYAIYRLPPDVLKALAGAARAYYSTVSNEYLTGVLEDSRERFLDDMKSARDE